MVSDTVAVGVLTFVGTGLATAAGLWQWQRARVREARADFRAQRVEALKEVWEALSDLEEAQRLSLTRREPPVAAEANRLTQVNLLLLRRSPFLRPDEQEWAQAFAQHLTEIDALIRAQAHDGQSGESDAVVCDDRAATPVVTRCRRRRTPALRVAPEIGAPIRRDRAR